MTRSAGGLLVLSLLCLGCGGGGSAPDGIVEVYGTVTLDKQPLPGATVTFSPTAGGRPSIAVTDSSGQYELQYTAGTWGALPGDYQVSITTASVTSDEQGNDVEVPEKLPARYNALTELKASISDSGEAIDFDLTSEGEVYQEDS